MDSGYPSLRPPAPAVPGVPPTLPPAQPVEDPFGRKPPEESPGRDLRKRIGSGLAAAVALIAKFFSSIKGVLLLLPKLKLLTTAGTAFVSVAAYSLFWGWPFAAGFVVLLFVHEMGHVLQLRREGIKASAPMFIPFLGAAIFSKSLGDNALAEARVGLAGPILGSLGAAAVAVAGALTGSVAAARTRLPGLPAEPVQPAPCRPARRRPSDGGDVARALVPRLRRARRARAVGGRTRSCLIIVIFGGFETWRRWKERKSKSPEQAAYYRVSPRNRTLVGPSTSP